MYLLFLYQKLIKESEDDFMINQRILDSIEDIFIPISSVLLISAFIANLFKFYFILIIKSTYHLR